MSLLLANILGWARSHWRYFAYGLAALILLIAVVVVFKSCGKRQVKLDQKAIIEAQQAIEANDRKKMTEILAESDAKEAIADGIIANSKADAVNAKQESKDKWNAASDEEMRLELERRSKQ